MKIEKEERNIHLKDQMMFSELLDRLEERNHPLLEDVIVTDS